MTQVGKFVYFVISGIAIPPVDDRVYPNQAPQSAQLPRVTYQLISTQPYHHLLGTSGAETARVQVNCWADSPVGAHNVADSIQAAMDSYQGALAGITVQMCRLDNRQELPAAPTDGSEQATHRVALDFLITYSTSNLALHT